MGNETQFGVSLVICTRNRFLKGVVLIKVLTKQKVPFPFEIIIVDASDKEDIIQIIKKTLVLYRNSCEISYIHTSVGGLSIQRNIGLFYSRYQVIGYIDDDMVPKGKSWLKNMVEPILNGDTSIVAGRIQSKPNPSIIVNKQYEYLFSQFEPEITENKLIIDPFFVPVAGNLFFTKENIKMAGGFRPNLGRSFQNRYLSGEESELLIFLRRNKNKLLFRSDSIVFHYLTNERLTRMCVTKRLFWQGITDYLIYSHEPIFSRWWTEGWKRWIEWFDDLPNQSLFLLFLHTIYIFGWFCGFFYKNEKQFFFQEKKRPYSLLSSSVFQNCDEWIRYGKKI
ncbi:hypothetical protein A2783_01515 [Microgenomates group bacterium RIFCSPHIGHO2_01_FULL_45_11]|nr:MAG: hypothetical protein A2783_01515 [Microgenomates group bacterium RIFCSPHIGHO2_01_FULL_45_11]